MTNEAERAARGSPSGRPETPVRVVHEVDVPARSMWRLVGVVLTTLTVLWAIDRARSLVALVVISAFLTLALVPGVNHLHQRFGWRRGAAVGAIYAAGLTVVLAMVGFLIPAIVDFARRVEESGSEWLTDLDTFLTDRFGIDLIDPSDATGVSTDAADGIQAWADDVFGQVVSIASSGLIENYWLSPRLSARTMTLNGGLAFGAALGGGALFGPMGAFVALPVAALVTSFIGNYRRTYDVVYDSSYADIAELPIPHPSIDGEQP